MHLIHLPDHARARTILHQLGPQRMAAVMRPLGVAGGSEVLAQMGPAGAGQLIMMMGPADTAVMMKSWGPVWVAGEGGQFRYPDQYIGTVKARTVPMTLCLRKVGLSTFKVTVPMWVVCSAE